MYWSKIISILLLSVVFQPNSQAQKQVKIATIGFYNLENLFDTVNDTLINDEDFLPEGANHWTEDKYQEKLTNMAYVISQIGIDAAPAGLSVCGVSEIENRKVLEDLVAQPSIADRKYQILHHDSPDGRGIDVAFLYNPQHFQPTSLIPYPVVIYNDDGTRSFTRDVLVAHGIFDGEPMSLIVNHWPSRRGGEEASAPRRMAAAMVNRTIVDSLIAVDPQSKIIIMGDLNDDPTSPSVRNGLRAATKKKYVKTTSLYNPTADFYRRGIGSNAYRDSWSLFDQVIISEGLLNAKSGYKYYKSNIFNKSFLLQKTGQYKDYPFRTFSGNTYQGGYSDHFPSYIYITKEVE